MIRSGRNSSATAPSTPATNDIGRTIRSPGSRRAAAVPMASPQIPLAIAPFHAIAVSPSGEIRMTTEVSAAAVAMRRPHGRSSANMPNATAQCCARPTSRSLVSVVPNTLYTAASNHSDPGPYRCRKSRCGSRPWSSCSGKASMKPSSIGGPW